MLGATPSTRCVAPNGSHRHMVNITKEIIPMKTTTKLVLTALGAACAWCALLRPRQNQPGWEKFQSARFAHRGLHNVENGIPENAMSAFRAAVERGFGAELDVHLMADGNLAVVHDSDLRRVCGKKAFIEDLTAGDLADYPLLGSGETIPLLEDVLALFEGRTPLIVELKAERGNARDLTDRAMKALQNWRGAYCVESFHPFVLLRLREKYPWVLRGQLSENFMRNSEVGGLSWPERFIMTNLLTTAATRPDFIAYNYKDRRNLSLRLMRGVYGVHEAGWTVRDPEVMKQLEKQGVTPIFEQFVP